VYNTAYTGQSFSASGSANTPFTFSKSSGNLPTGLSLSSAGALSGTPTATGTFTFTITATDTANCTGSQSFSLPIRPVAALDTYNTVFNNVQLAVTGGSTSSPTTPFLAASARITGNDTPSGGVTLTTGTFSTTQSGSVTIAADGTFLYTPPVTAFALTQDSFSYTISSDTGATGTPTTSTGTVNLILNNRVWWVKNNVSAGNGQSQSPFNSLAAAAAVSKIQDIVFVYAGDGTTNNLSTAFPLQTGQSLIGEGTGLAIGSISLVPAGSFPVIGNTTTLGNFVTIRGLDYATGGNSAIAGNGTSLSVNVRNASSTTGTTVNVSGGSGSGAITFRSVSSNGAASGIILNNYTGSFTVTGDGASDPNNTTRGNTTAKSGGGTITLGSGGTIQAGTGAGIVLGNGTGAVSITSMNIVSPAAGSQTVDNGNNGITAGSVASLTLDNVKISGFTGNSGLRGTGVANLKFQHVEISGNGTDAGTETNDDWNVRLDDLSGNCGSPTSGCGWNNSLLFGSRENIVGLKQGITNTTVSAGLTITNCEVRDTTTLASPANDGMLISTLNGAVTNLTITGSTLKNVGGAGFEYAGNDNASGTINVRNCAFEGDLLDVKLAGGGGGPDTPKTTNFDISGNIERQLTGNPASSTAIVVLQGGASIAGQAMVGTIKNNTIGNAAVSGSGSHAGDGIDVHATGAGTITLTVTGNTVQEILGDSFFVEADSGSGRLNLAAHGNRFSTSPPILPRSSVFSMDTAGTALDGLHLVGGSSSSDTATLCVDMLLNTLNGDAAHTGAELDAFSTSSSAISLVGMNAANNDNAALIGGYVSSVNTVVTPPPIVTIGAGSHIVGAANCGVTFPP